MVKRLMSRLSGKSLDEGSADFIACLAPYLSRPVAMKWWKRFHTGLKSSNNGHPSFVFIYDFTAEMCEVHRLNGDARRHIRSILTRAYYAGHNHRAA